ncbi:TIGR01244 family sulfur transferase [Oceanicaulis sp. LC35]|uniref:TIGR01244 family sulfur transferase n=1 Tax=Oceanicaulis sp. LC35 TaxID=3349635 RepID=UPI003F875906
MPLAQVSPYFYISGQIAVEDVKRLADQGFVALINNRPDGEAPDQPDSMDIEAAAWEAGLEYLHAPMHGAEIALADVERIHALTAQATGKVLGFCRSGARSMLGWALAQSEDLPSDEILALARGAGHDLSQWRSVFDARYAARG